MQQEVREVAEEFVVLIFHHQFGFKRLIDAFIGHVAALATRPVEHSRLGDIFDFSAHHVGQLRIRLEVLVEFDDGFSGLLVVVHRVTVGDDSV